ncbi:MAG: hypothetical protein IJ542_02890 [Clostridia bacterium]|nr:hypothetical protein [Clostridia bacterium]
MNIKLHNKFEIFDGENTFVAYNVVSHTILERAANFLPFATYFALGSGNTASPTSSINHLNSWVASFASTLEEIQSDISRGDTYVKRTVTIPANENVGLTFSEIGMTYSNESNPVICNYVNITNSSGENVSVKKKRGQELFIRVTIFLELSADAKKILCKGENNLVKALLGEYSSPVITAMRGENLQPNTSSIYRNMPRQGTRIACNVTREVSSSQDVANISIDYDLNTGSTAEVVILFGDNPVARHSTLSYCETQEEQIEASSQNHNTLVVDEFVEEISSVTDSNLNQVTNLVEKKFATDFSDYVANPFEVAITEDNARWVSKDGDKLAFVAGGRLYVYKNINYAFVKQVCDVSVSNLTKVIMFEDYLFAVYSELPRLAMYKCTNGEYSRINIDFTNYTLFDSTYDWQDIEIISNSNGNFSIGIILGQILRKPVIVYATLSNSGLVITSASYGECDYIVRMFSLYKSSFCDSMIGFITNNYNGTADNYRIEQHYPDRTHTVANEVVAYYLINGTTELEGKSRAVIAKKTTSPYIWLYYYPRVFRYSISLSNGVQNWISTNLLYLVQKYDDSSAPYKIYSLSDYNNPREFENGFPSDLDLTNITDFEFVGDTLLVFMTNGVRALNLKQTHTLLENLPEANQTYNVSYTKYELIGSSSDEGVNGQLSLELSL